jgi:DNA-directed RNA polymerase specialized sigma24 family protein
MVPVDNSTSFSRSQFIFSAQEKRRADESLRTEQFRLIMLPHLNAAYNFAHVLTCDANAAKDVVEDAYLCAFHNFDSWRGDSPKSWLLTIVRNCSLVWHAGDHDRYVVFE